MFILEFILRVIGNVLFPDDFFKIDFHEPEDEILCDLGTYEYLWPTNKINSAMTVTKKSEITVTSVEPFRITMDRILTSPNSLAIRTARIFVTSITN